jgi:hypothetical protein
MSFVTSLLNKLEFIGGIELNLVKLENAFASVRHLTPRLRLGATRGWYAQQSVQDYQRREYARRASYEIPIRNFANK